MKLKLKYSKYWLTLFILIWAQRSFAQKNVSFVYLDSLSYQQYLYEEWNGLIKSTRTAYKNDIDYYYLRMRTGIAYYEKHRFMLAEKHFKKAEKLNDIEKINKEYIYYSKLFAGKQADAYRYYYNNEYYLKKAVDLKKKDLSSFSIDAVYFYNPVKDPASLFVEFNNSGPSNGEQLLTLNYRFVNFKLVHDISDNLRLIHGGSFLNKNSYYYSLYDNNLISSEITGLNQIQYYGGLSLTPADGLTVTASSHFIRYSFPANYFGRGASATYIPGFAGNFSSSRISAYKYLGLFNLGGGLSYSSLNFKKQFQKDGRLVFYPLGNLNLYTVSSLLMVSEDDKGEVQNYTGFKQELGFKTFGNVWFEAKYQGGEIKNFTDHDGFSIFNSNDTQTSRYDFSLIHAGQKTNIRLIASYLEYYNNYFDLTEMRTTDLNKIESKALTIIAEISWKF
ncbi:MAG: hypothetical protein K9H49_10030 [Bacteroidales bacterium]|nr:hypothetical protein [Bacteroidales bacterium]MCF8389690.1 hypothetical protein [Bacteroidales bacterium]